MFKIALMAPHKTTLLLHPGLLTSLFTFFMYCVSPDNNRLLPGAALVWIVCLHRYRTCAWLVVLTSTFVKALVRAQNPQGRWKGYPARCGTVTTIWSFFFSPPKLPFSCGTPGSSVFAFTVPLTIDFLNPPFLPSQAPHIHLFVILSNLALSSSMRGLTKTKCSFISEFSSCSIAIIFSLNMSLEVLPPIPSSSFKHFLWKYGGTLLHDYQTDLEDSKSSSLLRSRPPGSPQVAVAFLVLSYYICV